MGRSFPSTSDRERKHRGATSAAMKRMAEANKCPKCGRKSAMKRVTDGDFWCKTCRWCGYAKGGYIGEVDA